MRTICDLRSDTVSVPCEAMRRAMAEAPVGDDVFGEDPSVNLLESKTAELLGKESAVFVPTGTMANGIAVRALVSPGDEVLCGARSHVFNFEGGQFALNGGIQLHPLDETPGGTPEPSIIEALLGRRTDIHNAPRTLVALEDTHNMLGGVICSRHSVERIRLAAVEAGVPLYLDGARFWHVAEPSELAALAAAFTGLSVCFSKALGCPVGSMVAGPPAFVERARWFRKRMGGGMRQAGILAGACLWALDNNLPRLPETHGMCSRLARAVNMSKVLSCDTKLFPTNILMADVISGNAMKAALDLEKAGVRVLPVGPKRIRLVTHLSLGELEISHAEEVLSGYGG
ncbi:MAG: GntG family PLP-dependent aldolase [Candidatus Fermentibacteraceae bacterium]